MDARAIRLNCNKGTDGKYFVFDEISGEDIASGRDAENAWAAAADRLARCLSDIRRSAVNME